MGKGLADKFGVKGVEDGVEDMTTVDNIDEDGINVNLKVRYLQDKIYTYTGTILVAVNPFKFLKGVFENDIVKRYSGAKIGSLPPHIYATAEGTYNAIRNDAQNQSVIISGESGAGKTESTKLILQYLTAVTQNPQWIEQQIMEANTLLEAFGNAKTVRNNNSSRFGKFTQVCFNEALHIKGCIIEDYLLEQVRVVSQMEEERNYHCFYQICEGAKNSADDRERYMVNPANSYHYLSQSGCVALKDMDDGKEYDAVKLAMTVLNMAPENIDSLFCVLSAILHIGNLKFADKGGGEETELTSNDRDILSKVSQLLQASESDLHKAFTYRIIEVRGSVTEIPLKPKQATDNRDAAAKAIYSRMFTWIVHHINKCTNPGTQVHRFIGVLDIFGFENFKVNSFEQLCINFTNEKLHKFFNHYVFSMEQMMYQEEGINVEKIKWVDNQACLDTIEKPPNCVLKLLDDECKFPKGTDKGFLEKMHKGLEGAPHYEMPPKQQQDQIFGIGHYAGIVYYSIDEFLDKNKDVQQTQIFDLMEKSSDGFVKAICKYRELSAMIKMTKPVKPGTKPTVGSAFRDQLGTLVETLSHTDPWYVRCIKPNSTKVAGDYDNDMVLDQLRYSGMLDIIRIRKMGYPVKLSCEVFCMKFRCLVKPSLLIAGEDQETHNANVTTICQTLKLDPDMWQVGHTKVFFKQKTYDPLEDMRRQMLDKYAVAIQRVYKGFIARKHYRRILHATLTIQRTTRGMLQRIRYLRTRRAVITIQSYIRGWFARDLVKYMKKKAKEKNDKKKKKHDEDAKKEAQLKNMAAAASAKTKVTADQKGGGDVDVDNIFGFLNVNEKDSAFASKLNDELDQIFKDDGGGPETDAMKRNNERMAQRYREYESVPEEPIAGGDPTLIAYAEKHMRQHPKDPGMKATLSFSKYKGVKLLSFQEMLQWNKSVSLPFALTKIEDHDNNTTAINLYKDICKYVRGELKGDQENKVIQSLVLLGLARPEMRDEVFIQCVKQINGNKDEHALRAWELMSFACVAFPCSPSLYKHMQAYFQQKALANNEQSKRAKWNFTTLKRTKMNGVRKKPPSQLEIDAIRGMRPIVCRFYFLDGKAKAIGVDPSATAQDCLEELADKIDLDRIEGWSLYERYPDFERAIRTVEYVCDILATWEERESESLKPTEYKTIRRRPSSSGKDSKDAPQFTSAIGAGAAKFVFRKRLFKNPREIPSDPVEYHLTYCQAVYSVLADEFPVTEKVALQLAGLQGQVLFGEYEDGKMNRYDDLEQFLPARIINNRGIVPPRSREGWKMEIADAHAKFGTDKTDMQSKVLYLTAVKQYPQYGTTFYPCTYKGFWSHPNKVFLAIDKDGFAFVSAKTRVTLQTFTYAQLQHMEVDMAEDTITLSMKPTKRSDGKGEEQQHFTFQTSQKEDIALLIASYSPVHRNWSQAEVVKAKDVHTDDYDKAKLYEEVWEARKRVTKEVPLRKPDSGKSSSFVAATLRRMPSSKKMDNVKKKRDDEYEKTWPKSWWSYSKNKLTHSLTVLENDDEDIALKMFMSILIFGGMSQSGGFEADEDPERTTMVQMVIAKCLEKDSLANEFYLQLIKQTMDHPDPNSKVNLQYWRFLGLTAAILAPRSDAILEYARAHLKRSAISSQSEESRHAQFVQSTLSRTIENKNRKYPPSRNEIVCVCNRKAIHARFHFLDGQFRALSFDSAATTQEVVDMIKDRIGLRKDVQGFSLFEVFGSLERNMLASEKVADAIFKWEKYAKSTNSTKQLRLTFKQRLFLGPFITPKDSVEFNLVFHQCIDDVVNDRHPLSHKDAVHLAGLRAQVEMGDFEGNDPAKYNFIVEKYVPKGMRGTSGIADEIAKEHERLMGMEKDECNLKYLEWCRSWSLSGSTVFEVLQSYTSSLPKNLWLAVNEHGIHILKRKEKVPLVTYNYRNIVNYSPSLRNLMIVTESLTRGTKFVFNTSQASQIAHLIRDYTHIIVQRQKKALEKK
jgi:myosin-7